MRCVASHVVYVFCIYVSEIGNILAVAYGDNEVSLWKEAIDGEWQCISTLSGGGMDSLVAPDASAAKK